MSKTLPFLLSILLLAGGCREVPQPALVVVLAVDQMRYDFLERFGDQFDAGLARLTREGTVMTRAFHDYAVTDTAPGHATLATGCLPSRHGIVGNSWWDGETRSKVYSVADATAPVLGVDPPQGRSPAHLQCATLGDWLKLDSPESKVFSVALKDRSAILMGGRLADTAYWYDGQTGNYVTSSWYRRDYPPWVEAFNASDRAEQWRGDAWTLQRPESAYDRSRRDSLPQFPHALEGAGYAADLRSTPFGDDLTFQFARELILHEELGADELPDLLWIGASAADYVGHTYGPYSREVQDYYLRLDRMLGEFLDFLDATIGPDSYVLVLTSDHGVAPIPEDAQRREGTGGRLLWSDLEQITGEILQRVPESLQGGSRSVVYFRPGLSLVTDPELPPEAAAELRRFVAAELRKQDVVEDAFTRDELLTGQDDRPYFEAYRRSCFAGRTPDILFRLRENTIKSREPKGTDHGTPYAYDTHVPLVLRGAPFPPGFDDRRVSSVDLAPTLAELLGVPRPGNLDGHPVRASSISGPRHPNAR